MGQSSNRLVYATMFALNGQTHVRTTVPFRGRLALAPALRMAPKVRVIIFAQNRPSGELFCRFEGFDGVIFGRIRGVGDVFSWGCGPEQAYFAANRPARG